MIDSRKSIFIVKIFGVKGIFHLPEESHNKVEITGYSDWKVSVTVRAARTTKGEVCWLHKWGILGPWSFRWKFKVQYVSHTFTCLNHKHLHLIA